MGYRLIWFCVFSKSSSPSAVVGALSTITTFAAFAAIAVAAAAFSRLTRWALIGLVTMTGLIALRLVAGCGVHVHARGRLGGCYMGEVLTLYLLLSTRLIARFTASVIAATAFTCAFTTLAARCILTSV